MIGTDIGIKRGLLDTPCEQKFRIRLCLTLQATQSKRLQMNNRYMLSNGSFERCQMAKRFIAMARIECSPC
jgi:hypothetical protein